MAPSNQEVLPTSLDALRARDIKDSNNEVSPDKQTLNDRRVLEFLQRPGVIGADGFKLDTAINLTAEGKTATEKMINGKLTEARKILQTYGQLELMERDKAVVLSTLENLKTPPTSMKASEAEKVVAAWEFYDLIKTQASRFLNVSKASAEARKTIFTKPQGVMDSIQDKLGDARENWDKLSTGQKLAMAGMALLGGIWMFKSSNEEGIMKTIKETLMTGLKVAGGAWLFNKVWYLFSGESFVDFATGTTEGSPRGSKFLMEAYRTDEKGAELMTKAFVQMGDTPFNVLLTQYSAGQGAIDVPGMKMPKNEAYAAFEIFMKKYGPADNLKKYEKYQPPISFSQVAIIEMSNDTDIKMKESLTSRVTEGISDSFKRGYNYLTSSAPALWMAEKYKKWFGHEATPDELKAFATKFGEIVQDEKDVNDAIKDRLLRADQSIAKNYIDTNAGGQLEARYNLKYRAATDGYIYMIVGKQMNNVQGDDKALNQTLLACIDDAERFLIEKEKVDKSKVEGKCEPHGTVFVSSTGTLKYLVRFKK